MKTNKPTPWQRALGLAGADAERRAEAYLHRRGLKLVARNYRCPPGEIDLIMRQASTVVFIEVRLRQHEDFGGAEETVDWRKRQRLIRAAQHYLQKHGLTDSAPCRFDVITLGRDRRIEWWQNAFDAS